MLKVNPKTIRKGPTKGSEIFDAFGAVDKRYRVAVAYLREPRSFTTAAPRHR